MLEVKKDIKTNELKLDRIYSIMEANAFGKNDDTISDYDLHDHTESVVSANESRPGSKQIQKPDKTSDDVQSAEPEKNAENNQNLDVKKDTLKPVSMSSKNIKSMNMGKKRPQDSSALKIMFVKLEGKIEDVSNRLKQIEYQNELISSTADQMTKSLNPGQQNLIQYEFAGMKHLVSRHQMSLTK